MKTQQALLLRKQLSRIAELDQRSPFDLSGSVRLRIAKTLRRCEEVETDFEKVRNELIRAKGKPDADGNINIDRNSPAFQGFVAAIDEILGSDAEAVPPVTFTEQDLNVEKNRIPIEVLNGLIAAGVLKE